MPRVCEVAFLKLPARVADHATHSHVVRMSDTMRKRGLLFVCLTMLSACTKKSSEERALPPQESLKRMQVQGDFHIELFAAEPVVMSPVDMAFDENGRIYVAEMLDYPNDPPPGKPARSRIRLLETDANGKISRSTIFADHLLAVSGLMPWKGGLIVTSAPDILFIKDTDGDGKADLRQVLYTGFPRVNQEARVTNPVLGVDNWIYCSNDGEDGRIISPQHSDMAPVLVRGTDFRFDPISGKAEAASGPAQFGSTLDEFGNRFITQNTIHIRHVVLPMQYLARTPLLQISAESQDISDHGRPSARMYPLTQPQEWRKERTQLRQQRYNENNMHVTERVGGWFTAASGGTRYDGNAWPTEYVGNVFTGDVSGNLIHRDVIFPDNATFRAHRAKDGVEFLASTDVWFRPCKFANAPDGDLYFTDIYRQVIETPESIPEEIRKKINFYNGDTLGRIYRIVPNHPLRRANLKPNLGSLSSRDLVKQLANTNGWNRWTAHRLLLERQDRSVAADLKTMAVSGPSPEARVHALWILKSYSTLEPPEIERALHDANGGVRQNALRLSEPFLSESKPLANAVLAAAGDSDAHVRFQAALTLGELKDPKSEAALVDLAHESASDKWFRSAILSSLSDSASSFYRDVLAKGESWTDPELLVQLSALIGARENSAELARWFSALPKLKHPEQELNGLAHGLQLAEARYLEVPGAEQALTHLIDSGSEMTRRAAWETSQYFALSTLLRRAMKEAADRNLPDGERVLAIHALRGGQFATIGPVLDQILQPDLPPGLEMAAIESLASFEDPAVSKIILKHWRLLSPQAHQVAMDAMVGHVNRVPTLLEAIAQGQIEAGAVDGADRSHLYENPDPALARKARTLLENSKTNREQVVAGYREALTLQGNTLHGKILFQANCARCHLPRVHADRVGPDLSGINNKTKEELLTDILNPSYAIEPNYVNYVLTTKRGFIYDGVIANETPNSITLRRGSQEGDQALLRKNVMEIRPSLISLMPEGFEEKLSRQDIADLIAYLRGGL